MKLYLAGTIHDPRISQHVLANEILAGGHGIVSQWHLPGKWQAESRQESYGARLDIATINLADLDRSDAVVAVPLADHHLRGMHVEVGYAIAKGKPTYVLGDHKSLNTMTVHRLVHYVSSVGELLTLLKRDTNLITLKGPKGVLFRAEKAKPGDLYMGKPYIASYYGFGSAYFVMTDGSVLCDGDGLYDAGYFSVVE